MITTLESSRTVLRSRNHLQAAAGERRGCASLVRHGQAGQIFFQVGTLCQPALEST